MTQEFQLKRFTNGNFSATKAGRVFASRINARVAGAALFANDFQAPHVPAPHLSVVAAFASPHT